MSVLAIDIHLERTDAVYFAGEVVRGTVALETTGNPNCRGFHIRLQGSAHVRWSDQGGASREDDHREAFTLFQSQRHTLVGNYYKTALLDEAGADADFDAVPNSGLLRIPCEFEEHSDENFQLIVRVVDCDWELGDDLLGEVLLDIAPLVDARDKKSFKLKRLGRPEQGQITVSAKWMPFEAVFPMASRSGERVSNNAIKPVCLELTIHNATRLRKANRRGQNNVYCQVYRIPEDAKIKRRKALPDPSTKTALAEGRSVYPFAFALRTDAPGSAELPVQSDTARLRYDLYANVVRAFWKNPSRKIAITVIPNRPVPLAKSLRPIFHIRRNQPVSKKQMCGCRHGQIKGLVSIHFSISRTSFAPGEFIDVSATRVESTVPEALSVSLNLVLHVEMSTRTDEHITKRHRTTLWSKTMPSNSQVTSLSQLGLSSDAIRMPHVFPSFGGGVLDSTSTPSSRHFACLRWSYTVDLVVETARASSGGAEASVPVLVAAAPPHPRVLQQESQSTAEEVAMLSPFSIFSNAVTNHDPSDTTPALVGPEQGGTLVRADGVPETALTFDEEEDVGGFGEVFTYVPLVHAATTAMTSTSRPPTRTSPSNDNAEEAYKQSSDGTVKALLTALGDDSSTDRRQTIGQWIRDHPESALSLSPDDVGNILSKVTFCLEQASVAMALTAGLGTRLTCAHICAAVRACPYQKAQVAKIMAPTAVDPENEASVLALIDYSFERGDVDKCFRSSASS